MNRISKTNYYLNIALAVASRSTCLRRQFGAVIVKDDRIISTGYNGAPRARENCCDLKRCKRIEGNIPHGEKYELCRSVHAEANAIIHGSYNDLRNSLLYLVGYETLDNDNINIIDASPCTMCERLIINAGITRVICGKNNTNQTTNRIIDFDYDVITLEQLCRNENSENSYR